jgi:hypothetical protein
LVLLRIIVSQIGSLTITGWARSTTTYGRSYSLLLLLAIIIAYCLLLIIIIIIIY